MHKKIKNLLKFQVALLSAIILFASALSGVASAATTEVSCPDGAVVNAEVSSDGQVDIATACAAHTVSAGTNSKGECVGDTLDASNCGIIYYINMFINILSAMVGIVVTGVIIWGGIIYSTSKGDPGKISEGKKKIFNGVSSLAMFIFAYAFLQWVVPGGIF